MSYTLYNADCLDILPTIEPQSVDAIICDPPYGTTACKWDSVIPFAPMWAGIKRVLRPRGACVLFGSQPFTSALVMSNVEMFSYEVIWDKINRYTNIFNSSFQPLKRHENILLFSHGKTTYNKQFRKGQPYKMPMNHSKAPRYIYNDRPYKRTKIVNNGDHNPCSVVEIEGGNKSECGLHPTQKPLALLEYLVKTYTNAGDVVLDFAMGSGTCGHACGNLGRRFVGIERDAAYFAIAEERIATAYAPLRMMQVAG